MSTRDTLIILLESIESKILESKDDRGYLLSMPIPEYSNHPEDNYEIGFEIVELDGPKENFVAAHAHINLNEKYSMIPIVRVNPYQGFTDITRTLMDTHRKNLTEETGITRIITTSGTLLNYHTVTSQGNNQHTIDTYKPLLRVLQDRMFYSRDPILQKTILNHIVKANKIIAKSSENVLFC